MGTKRKAAFGIAALTPIVLAGAVAAAPGGQAPTGDVQTLAAAEPQIDTSGVAVVPMVKPPADFRFASATLSAPPPAAVVSAPGGMRIPAIALSAYRKAEQTMATASPGCGVSWNLLAGIGRIESSHANGGATDPGGTAVRPIYGPVLDGTLPGNEIIVQSNQGGRPVYARAMGPMQFLPGTWSRFASDGDGDGKADPQNVFDAALSTARYLCSGGLNLRNQSQVLTAILRYNNSMAYAQNVLGWAAAYATGVAPVDLPPITGAIPVLGDTHLDANAAQGLGPGMPGLHAGDPLNELGFNMGNTEMAGQMVGPGPSALPQSEHGCQVICMSSQLPETQTATENLPPWMMPNGAQPWTPPWMGAPAPWAPPADAAPMPGMPAVAGQLPGPAPVQAPPAPGPVQAPLPGPAPAPGPVPGPGPGPEPILVGDPAPEAPVGTGALPGPA